jgi:hypothetical protein
MTATAMLSEPDALLRGNKSMLAPLMIDLLIASLLFLLVGWASDILLHTSTHESPTHY